MKLKKQIALFLALGTLFSCSACEMGDRSSTEQTETSVVKAETGTLADYKLRDNSLLYENRDNTEVVTMYLTVSKGNAAENTDHTWEEINTYSVYDYEDMGVDRYKVAGLLQVGDENGPLVGELGFGELSPNCTVQIRGQTSSRNPQKNYKISIKDNKGSWQGQTTIALNKHYSDGLRFRNKLAYDLIAGIDEMMGLRTTFVHLYVKDTTSGSEEFVDYGLYTQVEQLNKTAMKAHGMNKNGHLYKINYFEFYLDDAIKLTTDPTYDYDAFEYLLETKGNDDHTKLIEMLTALNDYSIPIETILEKYFDIENMSYWMAFQILIGNADTINRNFYMYSPLNSDKWYFISWDHDAAFVREEYDYTGFIDYKEWQCGVSNYWGNVLFQRALKSEVYQNALDDAIEDLRTYLTAERIDSMAEAYAEVVKPYIFSMPDVTGSVYTEEMYDSMVKSISAEIEYNYQMYQESYEKPMPFFIGVPVKDGDKLTLDWDPAYDFDAETITYTFELARDYTMTDILIKEEDILIPTISFDMLPEGQYFVRIRAENTSGKSQYAFDYYVIDEGKVYGVKCFYVTADGEIVEDVYVE